MTFCRGCCACRKRACKEAAVFRRVQLCRKEAVDSNREAAIVIAAAVQ